MNLFNPITSKIKNKLREQLRVSNEAVWAPVFHDVIRDKPYLKDFQLNVGRMAANYSYLYLIVRIVHDFKPKGILEFGLGESSKVISRIVENQAIHTSHDILEENRDWIDFFNSTFQLGPDSNVHHLPVQKKEFNGVAFNSYTNIEKFAVQPYDCLFVDGPIGTESLSRFDTYTLVDHISNQADFVVVIDDANRNGEMETIKKIDELLRTKGIENYQERYIGAKEQYIFAAGRYKFAVSV